MTKTLLTFIFTIFASYHVSFASSDEMKVSEESSSFEDSAQKFLVAYLREDMIPFANDVFAKLKAGTPMNTRDMDADQDIVHSLSKRLLSLRNVNGPELMGHFQEIYNSLGENDLLNETMKKKTTIYYTR